MDTLPHRPHLRRRSRLVRAVLLAVLLAAALVAWGAGTSLAAPGTSPASPSAHAARALPAGADWAHALQVVSWLQANPPSKPLVLMLGSSIVRESVTSDASWAAQIQRSGGPAVAAYDLGSTNQSFAQDLKLVKFLPQSAAVVYIGVDVVRFVSDPSSPGVTLPAPSRPSSSWNPHKYGSAHVLTLAAKRAKVSDWMTRRYPVFLKNYAYNLGQLRQLIVACQGQGLHPVLLDTPRNTAVLGSAWNKPVKKYQSSCTALARQHGIPFVQLVSKAKFVNTDFYDLYHAVQPGRAKWQRLLSAQTATLLKQYQMR
jgi:hypothetical protein